MGQGSAGKGRKRNAAAPSQGAPAAAPTASAVAAERSAGPSSPFSTAPLVWADMTRGAPHLAVATPQPAPPVQIKPVEAAPMAEAPKPAPARAPEPQPEPRVAATATVSAPQPTPNRAQGGGFGRSLAAGFIGAALAGSAVLAAAVSGYLPGLARSPDPTPQMRALADRVAAVEALRPRVEAAERTSALRGEVDQIKTTLAAVQERLSTVAASQPAAASNDDGTREALVRDVGRLSDAVAALDQRVAALDIAPLQSGLQDLRNRVASLAQASAASERSERAAALTLAVSALRAAVARGGAFQTELQAVRALGLDSDAVRALAATAPAGAPGTARLLERLRNAARAMIDAAQPAPENTFDRLTQAASRLVSVRPTGEVEGTTVTAVIARIEARLQRGDIAGAASEFETLPPAAQAAGQAFIADLRTRLEAERHIRALSDDISKLAPPRG